jgi:hypothetical protein
MTEFILRNPDHTLHLANDEEREALTKAGRINSYDDVVELEAERQGLKGHRATLVDGIKEDDEIEAAQRELMLEEYPKMDAHAAYQHVLDAQFKARHGVDRADWDGREKPKAPAKVPTMSKEQHDALIAATVDGKSAKRQQLRDTDARIAHVERRLEVAEATFRNGGKTREQIHREEVTRQHQVDVARKLNPPKAEVYNSPSFLDSLMRGGRGGDVKVGYKRQRNRGAQVKLPSDR